MERDLDISCFRPEDCPNCGYSWEGLLEWRCPECGETVEAGEIVVVGEALPAGRRGPTGEHWRMELVSVGMSCAVAGAYLVVFRNERGVGVVIAAGMFAFMACIIMIMAAAGARRGWPRGVMRFSEKGFRVGAGKRVGVLKPWGPSVQLKWRRTRRKVRLMAVRRRWGIPLWKIFDVEFDAESGGEFALFKRLEAWSGGEVIKI